MPCTSPRTVGFQADGKTIAWSQKHFSKEYPTFQMPCGKCIECRLDYARQWAIRCVHEASMNEENSFITLTYDDANLKPKLDYRDFQLFMKKLRKLTDRKLGVFVTGEYGEINKRPHWHAIIFNWQPRDATPKYKNTRGDQIFESTTLSKTWGKGVAEFGSVTLESAGYCARYAAKKLVHGNDKEHEFEPISKKSNQQAIGKKWLEKNWRDVFNHGDLVLSNGSLASIPRYYERWLKENHFNAYLEYLESAKLKKIQHSQIKARKEELEYQQNVHDRNCIHKINPISPIQRKRKISEARLKILQSNTKL